MPDSTRLAKRLAAVASCSRGEAEQYIAGGWVTVDGEVVEEPGLRVLPEQSVELLPDATLAPIVPVTLLLHKPAQVAGDLATLLPFFSDENRASDDHTHIRFVKRHLTRLALVAPLDSAASGLVVVTQDWRVARKLGDESGGVEQEYVVEVAGELAADGLASLNRGAPDGSKPQGAAKVSWQNETHLRFAVKAPQQGQIAGMCATAGLQVVTLKRIRIGRVPMAGLQPGQWRYLAGYQRF